jgi:hypothetical protein
MKIAIMQPYFFPYIGYFQMINIVDHFVFYDDVNYIKRGWINRNNILANGESSTITVPLKKASQNKLINEVELAFEKKQRDKMLLTIELAYKKAPFYHDVIGIIENCIFYDRLTIGAYAANTTMEVCNYLGIQTEFHFSTLLSPESKGMDKADRLIHIIDKLGGKQYINAIGGRELYKADFFATKDIELKFIKTASVDYKQFDESFISWLSIIDVMMFNSKEEIKGMLDKFELV